MRDDLESVIGVVGVAIDETEHEAERTRILDAERRFQGEPGQLIGIVPVEPGQARQNAGRIIEIARRRREPNGGALPAKPVVSFE